MKNFFIYFIFIISIIFLYDTILLYPIRIFNTCLHESSHALTVLLTGGDVKKIIINSDGSGYCQFIGGKGAIITPAGYLGSMTIGCIIFLFSVKNIKIVSYILSVFIILLIVLYVKNNFGYFALFVPISLIGMQFINKSFNIYYGQFVGLTCMISSVIDICYLVTNIIPESDASAMCNYIPFPAYIWAFIWLIFSIFVCYKTIKYTLN